jgi:hypothetical protein
MEEFIFIEGIDQLGNDIYFHHFKLEENIHIATNDPYCVAFNTVGFFKNRIESLCESPYFGENDGIYIKKSYYENYNTINEFESKITENTLRCVVFQDGITVKNTTGDDLLWAGLFSLAKSTGKISQFIQSCLPTNTLFLLPRSDGNMNRLKDEKYHDAVWETQIQPYIDYSKNDGRSFILGTLSQIYEEPDIKYIYLPLDDGIFEHGITNMLPREELPSWENRSSELCWRGGCNGGNPENIRVRFTDKIHKIYNDNHNVKLTRYLGEGEEVPDHYFAGRVYYTEFFKHKIFFIVDGAVIASNHMYGFYSGCVPFMISQAKCWFSHLIEPYVHYIPIQFDLSNLIEQIEWVRNHDAEAKQIAENAMDFAETYFSSEYQKKYVKESIEKFCLV